MLRYNNIGVQNIASEKIKPKKSKKSFFFFAVWATGLSMLGDCSVTKLQNQPCSSFLENNQNHTYVVVCALPPKKLEEYSQFIEGGLGGPQRIFIYSVIFLKYYIEPTYYLISCFFCYSPNRVSLYTSSCPVTHYINQVSLEVRDLTESTHYSKFIIMCVFFLTHTPVTCIYNIIYYIVYIIYKPYYMYIQYTTFNDTVT